MFGHFSKALVGAGLVLAGLFGQASPAAAGVPLSSFATVGERASVPYGWIDFCNRYAGECDGPSLQAVDIDLSSKAFTVIERINRQVNGAIAAVTDMGHWGVVDRWDYPTDGKGDCEDYALYKRRLLLDAGFPRQALLMTVVRDRQGEGHAILTVKTNRGEFVLDNLSDKVKPWRDTGYKFVKRQSQENSNSWVSLDAPLADPMFTAR
jgi:predicted transglutaminase-like cysteine proteinase